ncbi:MAG: hypothetical protein GX621_00330 [Pirellulaceae bacterium]|nr:hypothetical protein [Pirellulaceae bacterium]
MASRRNNTDAACRPNDRNRIECSASPIVFLATLAWAIVFSGFVLAADDETARPLPAPEATESEPLPGPVEIAPETATDPLPGLPSVLPAMPPALLPPTESETPTAAAPAEEAADRPAEPDAPASAAKRLRFNFRYQPWGDVLDWFAEETGYSLVLDSPPAGTFNYRDDRSYTPAEAMDVLNSVLLTKGYTLVLRDKMLLLADLEDQIPPSMIPRVPVAQLDERGRYELISTRFELKNITAEDAHGEIVKLLGPQGSVIVLPQARQLVITETGGRLREIRDVLKEADLGRDPASREIRWFELKSVSPEEAVVMLRQIFGMPEDSYAMSDGSLNLATDPIGFRLLASGSEARVQQVEKLLGTIDQSPHGEEAESVATQAAPQLEVYDVTPADPESVLKVMQTLLADIPGVRVATDPKTGNLIVLARPKEQGTVRATVDQMRREAQSVEVIRLRAVDPQLAVLAIGKLFANEGDKAPSVDADVVNRQLLIRGSGGQIAQIRMLLEKMGETFGQARGGLAQGRVRLVPVQGQDAEQLVRRLRELWPVIGKNELHFLPAGESGPAGEGPQRRGWIDERTPVPSTTRDEESPSSVPPARPANTRQELPAETPRTAGRFRLAATQIDGLDEEHGVLPENRATDSTGPEARPPIYVFSGPDGLYVSSDDLDALDQLQRLIDTLQGGSASSEPRLTVFYLRNAEAKGVAERLNQLLAGTTSAAPAAGAAATGILGSLGTVGSIGRITPSGPISITPDTRLNALLVQAAPADINLIEEVLRILDRRDGPEDIPAQPKPRLIPVYHTSASEIAKVVKDVYQGRMAGATQAGAQTADPRAMMMQMFRGRGGDASAGSADAKQDLSRMTIGVDERTNSLIVSAPETLFEEVRELVHALDEVASDDVETVEVVSLRESNAAAVREALSSLLGDSIQGGVTTGTATGAATRRTDGTRDWRGFTGGGSMGGGLPGGYMGRGTWNPRGGQGTGQYQGRTSGQRTRGTERGGRGR